VIGRLKKQLPYVVVLLLAGFLYYRATQFGAGPPAGRIGPDVWPKIILALAMVTCGYAIIRGLFFARDDAHVGGVLESIVEEAPSGEPEPAAALPPASSRWTLVIGIAMTVAYVVLVDKLGFFLSTALYLAGFMWVGSYRRIGVVLATSLAGALVFMFVFMKVVYVSLPLGVGPFAELTYLLMRLMGIR
jgi:putative tricarboxylic transport membrane protein